MSDKSIVELAAALLSKVEDTKRAKSSDGGLLDDAKELIDGVTDIIREHAPFATRLADEVDDLTDRKERENSNQDRER